jgi:hypothetical protein
MVFKLPLCFNSVFAVAVLILYEMNVFVLAILIYLLYRFIAGFLIPVIRTTSHVRQQFTQHAERGTPNAERSTAAEGSRPKAQGSSPTAAASKMGEYIDFEEVK